MTGSAASTRCLRKEEANPRRERRDASKSRNSEVIVVVPRQAARERLPTSHPIVGGSSTISVGAEQAFSPLPTPHSRSGCRAARARATAGRGYACGAALASAHFFVTRAGQAQRGNVTVASAFRWPDSEFRMVSSRLAGPGCDRQSDSVSRVRPMNSWRYASGRGGNLRPTSVLASSLL